MAAGEDIRIVDLAERPLPAGLTDHDFWLVDDTYLVRMHYSDDGLFTGAEPVADPEPPYQRVRAAAVAASEPFATWWQRHTEEWREHRAV